MIEALVGQAIGERLTKRSEKEIALDAKGGAEHAVKFKVDKKSALVPVTNWNVTYSIVGARTGNIAATER